jgi:excisionase family DNA binding protein
MDNQSLMKPDPLRNGPDPQLLTAVEVAAILKISTRTLWRQLSAGGMVRPVRIGGSVRWRRVDIERWVERGCPAANNNYAE